MSRGSIRPFGRRVGIGLNARKLASAGQRDRLHERLRGTSHLVLDGRILVKRVVTGRVRVVVTDVAIDASLRHRRYQLHVSEPVRERSPQRFRADGIAMNEYSEDTP